MKNTLKNISIVFIGIILATGTILTGIPKLNDKDMAIYREAIDIKATAGDMGFAGFNIEEYKIAFDDGEKEYVIDNDKVLKRAPVIDTYAATAYEVDGHYEVIVPTIDRMKSLIGVLNMGESEYDEKNQVATIWHESFHCYQLTNYYDQLTNIIGGSIDESIITNEIDENAEAVTLFKQQSELLERAVMESNVEKICEMIKVYKELEDKRNALLSDSAKQHEEYYTRVEGMAYYIESSIIHLGNEELFNSQYIDTIDVYNNGSSKYYSSGMAMCYILDKIDPDWKNSYDFSVSLKELMFENGL